MDQTCDGPGLRWIRLVMDQVWDAPDLLIAMSTAIKHQRLVSRTCLFDYRYLLAISILVT